MNELKLSLENFQSISQGELVFRTGTTVIIGQSNSGKTATFRALKACLSNPIGSQRFIKRGTNQSTVTLEYNGNCITWKRTPKESSYSINGEDFVKTGRSNAFKIIENSGFVVDDDSIMNIEEELQLPFPFGMSKVDLFRLYENIFCISDSAVILKAAKDKEGEVKNKISSIEDDIAKNQNKLHELREFKNEIDLDFLKEKKEFFSTNLKRTQFLKDGLNIIHIAKKAQTFEVEEKTFEDKIGKLSDAVELQQDLVKLRELHQIEKDLKGTNEPKYQGLDAYEELKKLKRTAGIIQKLSTVEAPVQEFDTKLQKYKELRAYSEFFKNLKRQAKQKKEELEVVKSTIARIEEDLKQFKVCPLCHRPIDN